MAERQSYTEVSQALQRQVTDDVLRFSAIVGAGVLLFGCTTAFLREAFVLIPIYLVVYLGLLLLLFYSKISYPVKAGFLVGLLYALGVSDLIFFGWVADARIFLLGFPILAGLLFGRRFGFYALALGTGTLLIAAFAVLQGWIFGLDLYEWSAQPIMNLASNTFIYLLVGGLLVSSENALVSLFSSELQKVMVRSKALQERQEQLDERAEALQAANYAMQRRVMHLEAGSEVAQAIATIFDLDQLLQRSVRLIGEAFGFYHTGLFLVDDSGERAVLRAASSEGGQRMLAQGHSLTSGEGMVGWVLDHQEPRIALDVGEDAEHFANPDLPATRSEVALPLVVGRRLLGVLDVQSTRESAFDRDDVRSLEFLAAQLALALENARRLSEETEALEATSPFYRIIQQMEAAQSPREIYTILLESAHSYNPTQGFVLQGVEEGEPVLYAELRGEQILFPERPLDETSVATESSIVEAARLVTQPLFVDDLEDLEGSEVAQKFHPALQVLREQSAIRSLVLLPIRVEGQAVAQVLLSYQVLHPFGTAERQLYLILANTASMVLENRRLLAELQRQVEQQRVLYEASRALAATSLREEERMRVFLESLYDLLDAEYVLLATVNEALEIISLRHGIWKGEFDVFPEWMEMAQYPLDSSDILASIYRSQRTEVIAGWDERFNREIYEAYHHEQLLRIFIPIMLGDRVLGVAEIGYDREEKRFVREEELQFLNAFMDQAAIALENARLFERAQRRVTQERLVGEITERMQQAPDMQSLLRVTADALTEVLGGSRAYARMTSPAPEVQEQVDEGVVD